MQCLLTAKLKLQTTPQQFRALRQTQLAYRDALNYVSRYAFAHGKMSGAVGLQERTYREVRATFGLPAQMACSVPRQVGVTYKALWTKVKANAAARAAGSTKKRYRGLDQAPTYGSPTLTYQLGRDDGFKTGQQVRVLTLEGRLIAPYTGYDRHVALIQQGARIGAAKLWYDQPHKQFYLLVRLELAIPDPSPQTYQRIVGGGCGPALPGGGHRPAAPDTVLSWHSGACQSGPRCPAAEARAAERHSLGHPTARRAGRTRETVEASVQPPHQPAERGRLPAQPDRSGGSDPSPRAEASQARQEGEREAAPGQPARLPVGLRGAAGLRGVQGAAEWQHGRQGRRLDDQPGVPTVWLHRGGQSP
jgi:predicted transposase